MGQLLLPPKTPCKPQTPRAEPEWWGAGLLRTFPPLLRDPPCTQPAPQYTPTPCALCCGLGLLGVFPLSSPSQGAGGFGGRLNPTMGSMHIGELQEARGLAWDPVSLPSSPSSFALTRWKGPATCAEGLPVLRTPGGPRWASAPGSDAGARGGLESGGGQRELSKEFQRVPHLALLSGVGSNLSLGWRGGKGVPGNSLPGKNVGRNAPGALSGAGGPAQGCGSRVSCGAVPPPRLKADSWS